MDQLTDMGELPTSKRQAAGQLPHLFLVGSLFETSMKRGEDMRKKEQNFRNDAKHPNDILHF